MISFPVASITSADSDVPGLCQFELICFILDQNICFECFRSGDECAVFNQCVHEYAPTELQDSKFRSTSLFYTEINLKDNDMRAKVNPDIISANESKAFFYFIHFSKPALAWVVASCKCRAQHATNNSHSHPGVDGRILYIVKAGDNCFRVAALHAITMEQLRQLNSKLDETAHSLMDRNC